MAATRLLKVSKLPLGLGSSKEVVSNSSFTLMVSRHRTQMCLRNDIRGLSSHTPTIVSGRKPSASCGSTCVVVTEPNRNKMADLALLMSEWIEFLSRERPWRFNIQMFIEKVIIDCRFFALLAVAGSLLGSVLCCVEGCSLILESYFQYFHSISKVSEQGHVVLLLIEALDMFLVGTAMLIFGIALHVMFVGTNKLTASTLSNYFNIEKLPSWIKMQSVMQAKSKIGHAVILILQVEILEKFKNIATTSCLDLACYAGVVFLASASIFILSQIALSPAKG